MVKNTVLNTCMKVAYYNLNMILGIVGGAVISILHVGRQLKWPIISQLCTPPITFCNIVIIAALAVGVGVQAIIIIPSKMALLFFLHGAQAAILSAIYLATDIIVLSTKKIITEKLYKGFAEGLNVYFAEGHSIIPADIDTIQLLGQCCGLHNYTDYPIEKVPESCCKETIHCAVTIPDELHQQGCYTKIIDNYEMIVSCFLIIIVLVPFVISLMSCYFAFEFKKAKLTERLNHNSLT